MVMVHNLNNFSDEDKLFLWKYFKCTAEVAHTHTQKNEEFKGVRYHMGSNPGRLNIKTGFCS